MAKLSDDDEKALAALLARRDAPDDDDGFEVWVKSGDHEARIPSSKAGGWLKDKFGIDLNPAPAPSSDADGDGDGAPKTDKKPTKGYFGNRT